MSLTKRAINAICLRHPPGFTLLEIMVSLSIIAIVFVTVFRLQARSITLAETGNFHAMAPYLVRIVLATSDKDLQDRKEMSGTFDTHYPGWSWKLTLHDAEPLEQSDFTEGAAKTLKRMDVQVSRDDETLTVSTWRYLPND